MSINQANYFGLLKSPVSWARVGRELVTALDECGVDMSVTMCKGFLYDESFELPSRLREVIDKNIRHYTNEITFEHPSNYVKLMGERTFGIITYEAELLPQNWVDNINRHLTACIVPSRYVAKAAADSGISVPVHVIPHGVNTDVFKPAAIPRETDYTFLCVASPHWRKGIGLLLDAWRKTFSPDEPVRLIIKSPPRRPGYAGTVRPWEIPDMDNRIQSLAALGYTIEWRTVSLTDSSMAILYNIADAVVQPSFGEGFGLAVLEALACGKPVITTQYGGLTDFCTDENALLLPAHAVTAGKYIYDSAEPIPTGSPDFDALCEALRYFYEDKKRINKAGISTAQKYSWASAAVQIAII